MPGSWTTCVWMLRGTVHGGVTCSVGMCLGVYACLDTKALTWSNKITACQKLRLIKGLMFFCEGNHYKLLHEKKIFFTCYLITLMNMPVS